MSPNYGLYFLLKYYCIFNCLVYGRVVVKKIGKCDPNANYLCDFNVTFTNTDNNMQVVDGLMILKAPLENTIQSKIILDILIEKNYVYLLTVNEKKSCEAFHKYFGEFAYDLERNAQILPGACPIAKGRYRMHNFRLDFRKVPTLVNFPFGNLRFTDHVYYNKTVTFCCTIVEVENWLG